MTTGSSTSSTKPAFVPKPDAETGTLKAASTCPAANSEGERTSSTVAPPASASKPIGSAFPRKGPRFNATTWSIVGGRGEDECAVAPTNSCSSAWPSAALNLRSKPIVVEGLELMPAPQGQPATCPG